MILDAFTLLGYGDVWRWAVLVNRGIALSQGLGPVLWYSLGGRRWAGGCGALAGVQPLLLAWLGRRGAMDGIGECRKRGSWR